MKNNKKKKRADSAVNTGLGLGGSEVVGRYGLAGAEYIKGYQGEVKPNGELLKGLKGIAESNNNSYANSKQQAGFAGEILFENQTNAENIINKISGRKRQTGAFGRNNHTQFDHVDMDVTGNPILDQQGNFTGTSQMKLRGHYDLDEYIKKKQKKDPNWKPSADFTLDDLLKNSAKKNVQELMRKKEYYQYETTETLHIPTEQYEHAKTYLREKKGKLNKDIIKMKQEGNVKAVEIKRQELDKVESIDQRLSKSVESKDAMTGRMNPKMYTAKKVHSVSHRAGIEQAKIGAMFGAVISVSRNIFAVYKGEEKDLNRIALNIAKDSAGAAGISYTTSYSGTVAKAMMERSGKVAFRNLSKTNMPAMIVTSVFEVSKSMKRYLTEEDFGELQLIEELGEKGTGMMAASIGAAVGTAVGTVVLPGVGSAVGGMVGGMVGYMVSATIYGSAMQLLKEERLSDENLIIVKQMAAEAMKSIQAQRDELTDLIETNMSERQEVFDRCLTAIDHAIFCGNHNAYIDNLTDLAVTIGIELKFKGFDDFDEFMTDDTSVFSF